MFYCRKILVFFALSDYMYIYIYIYIYIYLTHTYTHKYIIYIYTHIYIHIYIYILYIYTYIDGLHLFWFRKLVARIRVNLAGKKQDKHKFCQIKPRFSDNKSLGSEYCLNLENEDQKQYKEKSTLSNSELLPDPNLIHKFAFNMSVNLIL